MSPDNFRSGNHYIPVHYLKRWAASSSKVWTYKLLVPHKNVELWKRYSLETIAKRNHLYTWLRGGAESDELERWFCTDFESPASLVIDKVVAEQSLTPNDWRTLARFLALQDVRTPARMTEIVNHASEILPTMIKDVLENSVEKIRIATENNLRLPICDDSALISFPIAVRTEFEPGAETGILSLETVVGRAYWLSAVKVLLTDQAIKHLEKHRWVVIKPPKGMKWLTSDNPVVKLNYYHNGTFDLRGGWGNPGTEIIFPLSPEHLLYTQVGRKPRFFRGERLQKHIALQIQRFIVENAHRYIFSEQLDPSVPNTRSRTVNQEIVHMENQSWAQFHSNQTQAELALKNK